MCNSSEHSVFFAQSELQIQVSWKIKKKNLVKTAIIHLIHTCLNMTTVFIADKHILHDIEMILFFLDNHVIYTCL